MTNEIQIEENLIIPCPLKGFRNRRVVHCMSCEHYQGMAHKTVNGEPIEGTIEDSFMVICGRPVTRNMTRVEAD